MESEFGEFTDSILFKGMAFENDISRSQVVCAIGDRLSFYDNVFEVERGVDFFSDSNHSGELIDFGFQWNPCFEVQMFEEDYVGCSDEYGSEDEFLQSKLWFDNTVIPNAYKRDVICGKLCYFMKGDIVWVGGFE